MIGCANGCSRHAVPRRNRNQWQRRCLKHRKVAWLRREQASIGGNVVGESPAKPFDATCAAIDQISWCQIRNAFANGFHCPGKIGAQYGRQDRPDREPSQDTDIDWVDGRGLQPHQHLSRAWPRRR